MTSITPFTSVFMQGVPGGNVIILGGHSIGHCKQKMYMYVSYSEQFPRYGCFTVQEFGFGA
jgi:hypothetical protein